MHLSHCGHQEGGAGVSVFLMVKAFAVIRFFHCDFFTRNYFDSYQE